MSIVSLTILEKMGVQRSISLMNRAWSSRGEAKVDAFEHFRRNQSFLQLVISLRLIRPQTESVPLILATDPYLSSYGESG